VYSRLEGWSPVEALYFSVVTLATVGFGDLHPTTTASG
jgi:potassium channel subfamily K